MNKLVKFPLTSGKLPAIKKGTDWREYVGEASTPMIGIMVPEGVFVIDVDTHKGASVGDIEATLGLGDIFDWDSAILQNTLNGGLHFAFNVPHGLDLPNTTNILGIPGIDSRSSNKGYIATGRGYEDLTMIGLLETLGDPLPCLPALPDEFIKLIKMGTSQVEPSDLLSMVINEPIDLTDDEARLYVSQLSDDHAENQDHWLRVGMGIYHQYEGGEKGWELFNEFSKRSPSNYDERANRRRWESFAKRTASVPITFASVITMAGGRNVAQVEKAKNLLQQITEAETRDEVVSLFKEVAALKLDTVDETILVKAFKSAFKSVIGESVTDADVRRILKRSRPRKKATFHEDYVYLTKTAEFVQRVCKSRMKREAFNMKHNIDTPPDQDGNPQPAAVFIDGMIEILHTGMYAPQFGDSFTYDGIDYLNTFRPNTLERVDYKSGVAVVAVKKHIAHLLPSAKEQRLIINYLAHNVQFAGVKIPWSIILQGVQGDGKSFISEMMKHVLGASNCASINVESLDEKFTPWAEGNQMVFIEELKLDNYKKYETLNKLKPYITNPTVSVRRMREDTFEAINTTNYFALTNFRDALPIDINDRRYCVLFSQWQNKDKLDTFMLENEGYYPQLYKTMRNGAGEILDWLLRLPIDPWFMQATTAPETEAKRSMIEISKSDERIVVEDAIEACDRADVNVEFINITELQSWALLDLDFMNTFPQTKRLRMILIDLGYHVLSKRVRNDSGRLIKFYAKDCNADPSTFLNSH
jgi:hypothetical protein